jgi:hypothetical protein
MQEDLIIPLGVEVWKSDVYTLSFNEFEVGQEVYLEDLQSSKTFQINPEDEYHFVANSGDKLHRFNLHFGNALNIEENDTNALNIYSLDSKIFIQSTDILKGDLEIYNMVGQKVFSTNLSGKDYYQIPIRLPEGIYVVNLKNSKFIISEKVFIK